MSELGELPFPRTDPLAMPEEYRRFLDAGEVVRVTTPHGDPAWLVCRYDHVRQLLVGGDLGRSHPDPEHAPRYSSDMFAAPIGDHDTYPEDHARIRRVLTKAFNTRRMQSFVPYVESLVDSLLDDIGSPPQDFRERFAQRVPMGVITKLLGIPAELHEDMLRWSDAAQLTMRPQRAIEALIAINGHFVDMVAAKRERRGDDILSELIDATDEGGKLTDHELIRISHTLFFSGHTAATARIEAGTLFLLDHPEQRAALVADPSVAPKVVEEILRVSMPSFGATTRWARADIEVGGRTIRAGDLVLIGTEIAGHDPRQFPDPETFDSGRSPNAHFTFGHGNYYCVGSVLARLELRVVFQKLFRRLPELALAIDRKDLRLRTGAIIGGFEALPMTW